MSKTIYGGKNSITRDLQIDSKDRVASREADMSLKTVTKKFVKEPLSLESLEKKFKQMNEKQKKIPVEEPPKKRTRKAEEKAIFYDIFVKPKEDKIKEIVEKRNLKKKEESDVIQLRNTTYISNKITSDGKILGMNNLSSTVQNFNFPGIKLPNETKSDLIKTQSTFRNTQMLQSKMNDFLKSEKITDVTLLNNFLHEKYIINKNSKETAKKNYFNQLIQIRPPEGINAVVASPLMDSKGWAPSIPSISVDKMNTTLSDLMIRAKGGIKAGDITKEAHMAFYLGIMNEEEKKYETALKFYKKYFLSAKLLQDIYGTELALNRIGVLFSNIYDYEQSIYYNEKHKEITTHNLNGFVAFYNCGVCHRILENFEESIKNFTTALKMSEEENDLESYTLCLAQLAITYLFMGDFNNYVEFSEEFFSKNKSLNHVEMALEMEILSGYLYNYCGNFDDAKEFYKNALKKSEDCQNERYKWVTLCNIGIIDADKDIDDYIEKLAEKEEKGIVDDFDDNNNNENNNDDEEENSEDA